MCKHGTMAHASGSPLGSTAPVETVASRISTRVGAVAPSATLAVDAKAKELRAAGVDVIGFGAGEPDFPTPGAIVEAAVQACRDPANHKYTPTAGLPELRKAIAEKTGRRIAMPFEPSQVLVTNGGKHAIFNACATLLDPGDEVLIPAPYWTTYPEAVRLAGGAPVVVATDSSSGFVPSVADLEAVRTPATKLVILNSPSNPTGAVYDPGVLGEIGTWALSHGLWVLSDEIYESLVYGTARHASVLELVPELGGQCVIVNGVAKTYAMTGWRVGWLVGPPDLVEAAVNFQSQVTSNVSNVAQRAALAGITGDQSCVEQMRSVFDLRRQEMLEHLRGIPGVSCAEPEGAFYAFPSVEGIMGTNWRGKVMETSAGFADALLEEAKVAVVPGEAFGAPGHVRLSYAMDGEAMAEGLRRIAAFVSELSA